MRKEQLDPVNVAYERRNRDLDPQLVWRKDEQDWKTASRISRVWWKRGRPVVFGIAGRWAWRHAHSASER
jgi:hypothetical protein